MSSVIYTKTSVIDTAASRRLLQAVLKAGIPEIQGWMIELRLGSVGLSLNSNDFPSRHPERSRSSGGEKDLPNRLPGTPRYLPAAAEFALGGLTFAVCATFVESWRSVSACPGPISRCCTIVVLLTVVLPVLLRRIVTWVRVML